MASALKRRKIEPSVNGVCGEDSSEEHDFRDQEKPDSEGIGLMLLVEVLELVRHPNGVRVCLGFNHRSPPLVHMRKLPRLPREFRQSFPWAAGMESSIPIPSRPRDWAPRSDRSAWTTSGKSTESNSRRPRPWRPPRTSRSTLETPR